MKTMMCLIIIGVVGCTPYHCVRSHEETYQEIVHPGNIYIGNMRIPAGNVQIVPRTRTVCDEWKETMIFKD